MQIIKTKKRDTFVSVACDKKNQNKKFVTEINLILNCKIKNPVERLGFF